MIRLLTSLLILLVMLVPARAETLTILAFGDSLTAGYGLPAGEAFPVKLEAALRAKGHDVAIINGGVSGDTAGDGLARLEWTLGDDIDAAIVAFGGNDVLRGLQPAQAEEALDGMLGILEQRGLPALLAGMLAPPNLGGDYSAAFNAIYPRLAEKHGVLLYPFFLDGVAAVPKLNQADGIHPNSEGVDVIVARMLPHVEELLMKAAAK
jgi:acyl-CoA thioesterase-1